MAKLAPFKFCFLSPCLGRTLKKRVFEMAVYFYTSRPRALLNAFNARIAQTEQKGKITTWRRSDDKIYYTHVATEWTTKAWLKPLVGNDRLTFNIIKPQAHAVSTVAYGYYHGHLIETFLNHFDNMFTSAAATARSSSGDICS